MKSLASIQSDSINPIFLVGAERSGTTMFRLMLDNHPSICWESEFEYIVDLVSDNGKTPKLEEYHAYLKSNRIFQLSKFEIESSLSYFELAKSFLKQFQSTNHKTIVGACVHRNFNRLPYLWPNARYIYLIRDPRDVALSVIEMGWAGNTWHAIDKWLDAHRSWLLLKEQLKKSQYLSIHFETLISDPTNTLKLAAEFCGVNFDPKMLGYEETSTYKRPDKKVVQSWRKKASPIKVRLLEARVGDVLTYYGYEKSNLPVLRVGFIFKLILRTHNYITKVKFRIGRYGLRLLLLDFLARKVHLDSLREKTIQQLNFIDNQYIK